MKLICSNCGTLFPKKMKFDPTYWVCTGECYLNWFRRHFPDIMNGKRKEAKCLCGETSCISLQKKFPDEGTKAVHPQGETTVVISNSTQGTNNGTYTSKG